MRLQIIQHIPIDTNNQNIITVINLYYKKNIIHAIYKGRANFM